ncbi:MAG TPA: UDPGP type 1 family protein [Lachnospiraceae bacterium]|nr:UDPGP type 1 family protein [Lachnospiraceae bacterium]
MNYVEALNVTKKYNQEQLLKYYDRLSEIEKVELLRQIANIDWSLLAILKKEKREHQRGVLEPLDAIETQEIQQKKDIFYQTGMKAIQEGKVAAVLLAGGQGTRLGFDKPKGMLNVGETKELFLFEQLINNVTEVAKAADTWIPFYIMTSEKNQTDTINFFEENHYFGYPKEYIKFFMQEMAPSVDYNGKILLEGYGRISLSPNGNGGWFSSMKKSGVLEDAKHRGVIWFNIFSVDNVLQKIADPLFIGATIENGNVSGAKVVKKVEPEERVGVLCKEDGKPAIVEYYEMTNEMLTAKKENGDLQYSFGVTLNYLFHLDQLEDILNDEMPTHVVEKKIPYLNEQGNLIKPDQPNGYKFEQLVLDMIHMLDNCLPYEVIRKEEFAPIKNRTGVDSLESARLLMKENGIPL